MPPEIPDPIATIRSVDIRVINIEIVSSKYEMLPTNNIVKTSKLICMCAPELMILGRDIAHVRFNLLKTCMNYLTDASKVVRHFERNWSGVQRPRKSLAIPFSRYNFKKRAATMSASGPSGHRRVQRKRRCLLNPQQLTCATHYPMSAKGQ